MKNETVKTGVKVGATIGVIAWFLVGILAGVHFGGYSAIILMDKIFGSVEATLISRAFVVMGMGVGIATVGSACLVVGGLLGAFFGWVMSPVMKLIKQTD